MGNVKKSRTMYSLLLFFFVFLVFSFLGGWQKDNPSRNYHFTSSLAFEGGGVFLTDSLINLNKLKLHMYSANF